MKIELPKKLYYSIGEVSKAFGVAPSLIRFWEKQFDEINPKKNRKGNRLFTPEDIKNLNLIYHLLKERGHTIEGAKQVLSNQNEIRSEVEIIGKLEWIKSELESLKSMLDEF